MALYPLFKLYAFQVQVTIPTRKTIAFHLGGPKPGTLLSCAGGCIGWAQGATLGAKLAAPDKTVISLMGDGAFIYGCPESSLWSASFYKAPFLAIIYDDPTDVPKALKGCLAVVHAGQAAILDVRLAPV
jgi:acetolactate synthase-1/2/3 large subunit